MSKQLKSIKVYPTTNNTVRVVTDHTDYSIDSDENKIITRTPDHYPVDKNTIHANVKDGYGKIINIVSSDPLVLTTSGYSNINTTDYDGLLVNGDGSIALRGVISDQTDSLVRLINPASFSIDNHYYLMGGVNEDTDAYVASVWHSADGSYWEQQSIAPWDARANFSAVSDGTYVWVVGGQDYSEMKRDIWRGIINTTTGEITWDGAALYTGLSLLNEYTKAALLELTGANHIAIGSGLINLSTGAETVNDYFVDGYETSTHYDKSKRLLWNSGGGERIEQAFETDDTPHFNNTDFSYVHLQSSANTTWTIPATDLGVDVVVITYDLNNNLVIPITITDGAAGTKIVTFHSATSGRAIVLLATPFASSTIWSVTADSTTDMLYFCNGSYGLIEPDAITWISGSQADVAWHSVTDGYCSVIAPYEVDNLVGRKYCEQNTAFSAGDNTITNHSDEPLVWGFRDSDGYLIAPVSLSSNGEDTTINFIGSETAGVSCLYDARNDDLHDLDDPYSATYVSCSYNEKSNNTAYIIDGTTTWKSITGGSQWVDQSSGGVTFATDRSSPIVCEDVMIATINDNYEIVRSVNSGTNYSSFPGGSTEENVIHWYGSLGAIDDTFKLYVYERPADVVWESSYGSLPTTIVDPYYTHYILPYPQDIISGNKSVVQIQLDAIYDRVFTGDELKNKLLYLVSAADGSIIDKKPILGNTSAVAGEYMSLYCEELNVTPSASHKIQIINRRPEGATYYSAITRNETLKYNIYHEDDGSAFNKNQEISYDYYADLVTNNGLPSYVQTDDNLDKVNLLHAELNRNRVMVAQDYYNPYKVVPEFLDRLAAQYGLPVDDNIDLKTLRRAAAGWFKYVDGYGFCSDGLQNIIDIIVGPNSGISIVQADPNANTMSGRTVTIDISSNANYSFTYLSATNTIQWDPSVNLWGMEVDYDDIPTEVQTITHMSLMHGNGAVIDGPWLIRSHAYSSSTNKVTVFFDDESLFDAGFIDASSVLSIFDAQKIKKIFSLIKIVNSLKPHWVQILWT